MKHACVPSRAHQQRHPLLAVSKGQNMLNHLLPELGSAEQQVQPNTNIVWLLPLLGHRQCMASHSAHPSPPKHNSPADLPQMWQYVDSIHDTLQPSTGFSSTATLKQEQGGLQCQQQRPAKDSLLNVAPSTDAASG